VPLGAGRGLLVLVQGSERPISVSRRRASAFRRALGL
jgi:hypothetical protein